MGVKMVNKIEVNKKYKTIDILLRMLSYFKKYKSKVFFYLILSGLGILINILFANIINSLIEAAIKKNQALLYNCIYESLILIITGTSTTFFSKFIYNRFKAGIMLDIRNSAVEHLQKLPLWFIENHHTGELISRYTSDMSTLQTFIGNDILDNVISFISFVATSVYLISINWKLYLVSLILMPPVLYLSTKVSKPMGTFFKEASANLAKANSVAKDVYGGIFIVKSFNLQKFFHEKFSSLVDKSFINNIKAVHRLKWMPPFNILLWSSPFTICLIFGTYLSLHKEITAGQLPAFVYLLNNIVWPISAIPRLIGNVRNSLGTSQRFFEILDTAGERNNGESFKNTEYQVAIKFKNVSYSYFLNNLQRNVISGMDISLSNGSKTALVGASGCGKSTILKLIMGFYDVQEGKIEIFGHDLNSWNLKSLRTLIAYVSQDTYLFPASILENIQYGRLNASRNEVIEASIAANAHEFIMGLPEGYDTYVGERGIKLSGGQKQRISIARAFLKNAPLILLDEPTSALDTISESVVQESIRRLMENRTTIYVAHRLSSIKDADQIFVVDKGKIVEIGTHNELMSLDGTYFKLYSRQVGGNL
jgi:ABC-type multidrug transport system fused ATPase/permease subunit